ncbi:MAG: MerR family transcriptional regulator [Actinomycetota bacterium]
MTDTPTSIPPPDSGEPGPLLTIGSFSRATLVSVRSLRAYHERGLLVPAAVDPATGYRGYHPGQIADAVTLRRLRELDVPLDTIAEILGARDPELTTKLLGEHRTQMQARLAETELIVARLQRAVDEPSPDAPIHVRTVEHADAIAIVDEVAPDDYAAFFADAYARLWALIAGGTFALAGPSGALFRAEVRHDDPDRVVAYLPVTAPAPIDPSTGVELVELPATTVAVAVHEGSYDDIDDAYASLGAWVAYHGEPTGEDVREVYVVSYDRTDDPSKFRSEIHWPIRPR